MSFSSNYVSQLLSSTLSPFRIDQLLQQHLRRGRASSDGFRFVSASTSFKTTWWLIMNSQRGCRLSQRGKSIALRSQLVSVINVRRCVRPRPTDSSCPRTRTDRMPPKRELGTPTASSKVDFSIDALASSSRSRRSTETPTLQLQLHHQALLNLDRMMLR